MDKITNRNAAEAAKVMKTPDTSAPRDDIPINVNDPITFCDKHDILYKGVAKWIGTDKPSDAIVVGIEVVSDIMYVCMCIAAYVYIHLYTEWWYFNC